ncbi:hypothetical protein HYN48_13190 [Flavobacterium magnum]|uniref:CHAT domain-containing protein n=1 Tax=Flavobacterium magnum TaxID=2162713 RepID=A0A2S0RH04_9FLAO|nr:CHAT domain-containing protein [Flavobacterium magnum]AWA30954.1 hypothetical protein HYN48_13190 [Flavobacterium magnum]
MIKIPLNRAIELLQQRLTEVDNPHVDLKALQSRIMQDIERIFGRGTTQSLSAISLETLHFDKPEKLEKCKTNFRQTIQGWIEYIKDFNLIEQEQVEISEQQYKEKYSDLLTRWNDLVPEYNELLKNYENIINKYDESLSEIKILQEKLTEKQYIPEMIKILFLGASPIDEVRLRVDEELRDIEHGLKLATLREQFELKSQWAITTKTLQQAMLDEAPTIVHFSGHGSTSGIAVEDSLGNAKLIENDALGSLFELFSDKIECVVLNSCHSESQAKEIAKHIPYVIGMKSSVNDKAAIAFAVGFYTALGAGKDIPFAFKMGTVAVKLEGISGSDLPILLG